MWSQLGDRWWVFDAWVVGLVYLSGIAMHCDLEFGLDLRVPARHVWVDFGVWTAAVGGLVIDASQLVRIENVPPLVVASREKTARKSCPTAPVVGRREHSGPWVKGIDSDDDLSDVLLSETTRRTKPKLPDTNPQVDLASITVLVKAGRETILVNGLLDWGANSHGIDETLIQMLKLPPGNKREHTISVAGGRTSTYWAAKYEIEIRNPQTGFRRKLLAYAYPRPVGSSMPTDWSINKKHWPHLKDLPLQPPVPNKPRRILIGTKDADLLGALQPSRMGQPGEPVATKTLLGWTVKGPATPEDAAKQFHFEVMGFSVDEHYICMLMDPSNDDPVTRPLDTIPEDEIDSAISDPNSPPTPSNVADAILPNLFKNLPNDPLETHPDEDEQNRSLAFHLSAHAIDIKPIMASPGETTSNPWERKCQELLDAIPRLWAHESLEEEQRLKNQIAPAVRTKTEQEAIKRFHSTLVFEQGHYMCGMIWKSNAILHDIPQNFQAAARLFRILEQRFRAKPEMALQFHSIIKDWLHKGFLEIVRPEERGQGFHIPCFMVVRLEKASSKYRMVMNAARKFAGSAINDFLSIGPNKIANLLHILLRFRRHLYAINMDVESMFLKVWVTPEDRQYLRLIYREQPHEPLQVLQATRHVFGLSPSPSVAIQTVQHHANKHADWLPQARDAVHNNMMVDDVITTSDSCDELKIVRDECISLFNSMDMDVHKFVANDMKLLEGLKPEQIAKSRTLGDAEDAFVAPQDGLECPIVKTLGVTWQSEPDTLTIEMSNPPEIPIWTLRRMSSWGGKFFDPLGLFSPISINARLHIQAAWVLKLGWDDPVPPSLASLWLDWSKSAAMVHTIQIPRPIRTVGTVTSQTLLVFSDASSQALGAAAYIRTEYADAETSVRLLASRNKVSSKRKPETIPRLELHAATIGVRLALDICEAYAWDMNAVNFFVDSITVLWWLHSARPLEVYVANRVCRILDRSSVAQWNHVTTDLNPADLLSRGRTCTQLKKSDLWWERPEFLKTPPQSWPKQPEVVESEDALAEVRNLININHMEQVSPMLNATSLEYMGRFSQLHRGIRAAATLKWWMRKRTDATVTILQIAEEIKSAWIKREQSIHLPLSADGTLGPEWDQLQPYLDSDGFIRADSTHKRAQHIPYQTKHPIILPRKSPLTRAIIQDLHDRTTKHTGGPNRLLNEVRRQYWVPHGRPLCREVIRDCAHCSLREPRKIRQCPPPYQLHAFRHPGH